MNKDGCYTSVHMHHPRTADLFEEVCKDRLPSDDILVPPQHQPVNPEDEDDVVPDQHAAFGIQRATQAVREPAWRDLGLEGLMERGRRAGEAVGGTASGGGPGTGTGTGTGTGIAWGPHSSGSGGGGGGGGRMPSAAYYGYYYGYNGSGMGGGYATITGRSGSTGGSTAGSTAGERASGRSQRLPR